MSTSLPWWRTDTYDGDQQIPAVLEETAGPKGIALVRLWDSGKTDPGWGLNGTNNNPGFMAQYTRGRFKVGPILMGEAAMKWNFAFVMRSMRVVCIDIDGKNGGLEHAGRLGMLPYTLAEVSKSGNGYHLFYATESMEWDDKTGFGGYGDRIGLEQGVDFRGTGCVFHYRQQRWNSRPLAELPVHLKTRLIQQDQKVSAQADIITKILEEGDKVAMAIMHDDLITDLAKPITHGRRNNTLFAIGNQMKQAQVPDWEKLIDARALQLGLEQSEAHKLTDNITKYGN